MIPHWSPFSHCEAQQLRHRLSSPGSLFWCTGSKGRGTAVREVGARALHQSLWPHFGSMVWAYPACWPGGSPLCWVGSSARTTEVNAGAILPEVSIRRGNYCCKIWCRMWNLHPGPRSQKKRRQVQVAKDGSPVVRMEPGYAASTLGLEDQIQHSSEAV